MKKYHRAVFALTEILLRGKKDSEIERIKEHIKKLEKEKR